MSYGAAKKAIAAFAECREAGSLGSRLPSSGVTYDTIVAVAEAAVKESPTSFNCQDTRVLTLLGGDHERYWRLFLNNPCLTMAERIRIEQHLLPAMGTMLLFVDNDVVQGLCSTYPTYAKELPMYATQGVAMAVTAVWSALCTIDKSLGAVDCHFGYPVAPAERAVDEAKRLKLNPGFPREMSVPESWLLVSELVFGSVERAPCEVAEVEDSRRCMVFSDTYTSVQVCAPVQQGM